jgi:single-strand DNA-binding protein
MNLIILIGNVGNKPEQFGERLVFNLATSKKYKTADGEQKEVTEWHKCKIWGEKRVQGLKPYLNKGDKIAIVGEMQYYVSENDAGEKKYFQEVRVNDIEFLSSKKTKD